MAEAGSLSPRRFAALVRKLRYKQYRGGGIKAALNIAFLAIITLSLVSSAVGAVVAARYDAEGTAIVAAFLAVVLVAWTTLPIAFAAGNSVVDPQLYAMYPISRSTLAVGFLSAAFISMPAIGSLIVALSLLAHARSIAGGFVIAIAGLVAVVTAVLSSQTVQLFFSRAMRRRSTKDFAAALGAVVAVSLGMVPQILVSMFEDGGNLERGRSVARWLNAAMVWLPWGWAPSLFRAGADQAWGRAAVFGILAVGWIVVLFRLWSVALERSLVERPAKSNTGHATALVTPLHERLLGSSLAAVSTRSRRELYRDARQLTELAAWLPLLLLSAVPGWDAIRSGADELVLSSALVGVAIGTTALNLFGYDGASFGLDVLVDHDLGLALRGKLVARFELGFVIVTVIAVALAAITGGWRYVPTSIVFAMCGLAVELAIGAIISVRYPFPVPPKAGTESMFYNPGCVNQLVRFGALFVAFLITAPLVGPATVVSLEYNAAAGFAVGLFGLALSVLAYRSCVGWAERRLIADAPEMFQVLSVVG